MDSICGVDIASVASVNGVDRGELGFIEGVEVPPAFPVGFDSRFPVFTDASWSYTGNIQTIEDRHLRRTGQSTHVRDLASLNLTGNELSSGKMDFTIYSSAVNYCEYAPLGIYENKPTRGSTYGAVTSANGDGIDARYNNGIAYSFDWTNNVKSPTARY